MQNVPQKQIPAQVGFQGVVYFHMIQKVGNKIFELRKHNRKNVQEKGKNNYVLIIQNFKNLIMYFSFVWVLFHREDQQFY